MYVCMYIKKKRKAHSVIPLSLFIFLLLTFLLHPGVRVQYIVKGKR